MISQSLFLLCIKAKKMGITFSDAHFGYNLINKQSISIIVIGLFLRINSFSYAKDT